MAFTGSQIEIPIGQDGLNGAANLSLVRPNQLIDARNISLADGPITKEGGATNFNASALAGGASIIGGYDWWPGTATQRTIVLTSNGAAYRDTGGGSFGTTLATGLGWTTASVPVFAEGGREVVGNNAKLFIATGDEQVQVLSGDGTSLADISSTTRPSDWASSYPRFVVNHDGRLWAGGNDNFPHQLYYSLASDFENFTTGDIGLARVLPVYPGEGRYLAAAASFQSYLVVWKYPRGVYLIDTTDPDQGNWIVKVLSRSIGIASPRAWCQVEGDILFMDPSGSFHLLTAVSEYGDLRASNISARVWLDTWVKANTNLSQLTRVQAAYYPTKREAHFACAAGGSTVNNLRIIWDFNADLPRAHYSDLVTAQSLWIYQDASGTPRLRSGSDTGYVRSMDQDAKTLNNAAYASVFQSAHLDFVEAGGPEYGARRKNYRFLEIVVQPAGSWDVDVEIYLDGEYSETVSFDLSGVGAVLGSFVLDTDELAGSVVLNRKKRLVGSGRRISLRGVNDGVGEDFSISRFLLHFQLGNDQL